MNVNSVGVVSASIVSLKWTSCVNVLERIRFRNQVNEAIARSAKFPFESQRSALARNKPSRSNKCNVAFVNVVSVNVDSLNVVVLCCCCECRFC